MRKLEQNMIRHNQKLNSESWKDLPWKQFYRDLFRLQKGSYKAIREGDTAKVTAATDGFEFLVWHIKVQENGKFRSCPSVDNFKTFRKKIKTSSIALIMVQSST